MVKAMILAMDECGNIGRDGKIPWGRLKYDMKHFREITFGYDRLIMGRKTWDSLPNKPLEDRKCIVISNSIENELSIIANGGEVWGHFDELENGDIVIGGNALFEHYIDQVDIVYLTYIDGEYIDCDVAVSEEFRDKLYNDFDIYEYVKYEQINSSNKYDRVNYTISRHIRKVQNTNTIEDNAEDSVNHPSHYNQGTIETIDCIENAVAGYSAIEAVSAGNVVKYVSRAPFKGSKLEDLKKARWYLNRLIKHNEHNE